jgi:DNA repair protein RecO (recombination protein O)
MAHTFKAEGIILKRKNFSEADKLITILTRHQGKIVVIAKGIRRIRSKKSAHLELFNVVSLFLAEGRNFDIVTEVQSLETFPELRLDIHKIAYCYELVEVVDKLCPDHQEVEFVYEQLLNVIRKLNVCDPEKYDELIDKFFLTILWELGFLPMDQHLSGISLRRYIEQLTEHSLKSQRLLTKVTGKI